MKTRTLLLLSLACAVAILAAGGAMWWRISDTPTQATTPIGAPTKVGDMTVTVFSAAHEADSRLVVDVSLVGASDDAPADDFVYVVDEAVRDVTSSDCPAVEDQEVRCTVSFDGAGRGDAGGLLFYRRGEERAAWFVP